MEVVWSSPNHWVAASIGLLGGRGDMMATTPSIIAHLPSTTQTVGSGINGDDEGDASQAGGPDISSNSQEITVVRFFLDDLL